MPSYILDHIANFFLSFGHGTVIIPLAIIGYLWLDKKIFFHAICLILMSMLFNFALKITFQVPLSPTLNKEGFAFPSGHMQASVVLYGWLFTATHNFFIKMLIVLLLLGIGFGLIYFDYHNYFDLLGALFFGLLLIGCYKLLLKSKKEKVIFFGILFFSTLLMTYIAFFYEIKEHVWMAYYTLLGIVTSEYAFGNKTRLVGKKEKAAATVFLFLMLILIKKAFALTDLPLLLTQTQWVIIGFCIPFSSYLLNVITSKRVPR